MYRHLPALVIVASMQLANVANAIAQASSDPLSFSRESCPGIAQAGVLLLPTGWARSTHTGVEIGWRCLPFNDLPTLTSRIAPYGTCLLEPGQFAVAGGFTIRKPMKIEAVGGTATIRP